MNSSALLFILLSAIVVLMRGGLLLIWNKMQQLQQALQTQNQQESPAIAPVSGPPVSSAIDVPVLGLLNHGNGHGSVSISLELAEIWSQKGLKTLIIETDPLQPIASRLNLKGAEQPQRQRVQAALEWVYLNPAQPDFESQWGLVCQGMDRILLSLPGFSHPGFEAAFQQVNEYILTLELSTDSIKTLKSAFNLLKSHLKSDQKHFLGIQIVSYQANNPNQQSLYQEIQESHRALFLAAPFSEECPQEETSARANELATAIQSRQTRLTAPAQLVGS